MRCGASVVHKLLARQLAKAKQPSGEIDLALLTKLVSAAYAGADRRRADRSIELMIAEVRASQKRLREALDVVPEGFALFDAEDRYVLWNKRYEEIYPESCDLFSVGKRFEDALRESVARGQYPDIKGREEAVDRRTSRASRQATEYRGATSAGRSVAPRRGAPHGGRRQHRRSRRHHRFEAARSLFPAAVRQQPDPDVGVRARKPALSRRQRRRCRSLRLQPRPVSRDDAARHQAAAGQGRSSSKPSKRRPAIFLKAGLGGTSRRTALKSTSRSTPKSCSTRDTMRVSLPRPTSRRKSKPKPNCFAHASS